MASQDAQPFHWHYTEFDDRSFQISGRTLFFIIVVCSVVLLITLLFFYARWVCRYGHFPAIPHLPHPASAQRQGLDPAAINSLPIVLHSFRGTNAVDEAECCICLGTFQDGDKIKVLPQCHHSYHSECVNKWLSSRSSCPLCRASLLGLCCWIITTLGVLLVWLRARGTLVGWSMKLRPKEVTSS